MIALISDPANLLKVFDRFLSVIIDVCRLIVNALLPMFKLDYDQTPLPIAVRQKPAYYLCPLWTHCWRCFSLIFSSVLKLVLPSLSRQGRSS